MWCQNAVEWAAWLRMRTAGWYWWQRGDRAAAFRAATTLVDASVTDVAIGFNDLTTDHAGRVWVGSLVSCLSGEPLRPGHLHVVDVDATVHTVSDDVTLTNGLGFSPDGGSLPQ